LSGDERSLISGPDPGPEDSNGEDGPQNCPDTELEICFDQTTKKPARLSPLQRRGKLPDYLYNFCNTEEGCLREIILDHYKEPTNLRGPKDVDFCCSNCNPTLAELASLPSLPKTRKKRKVDKDRMAISILMKAQCAERVIQKYPRLKLAPDWRMWISSEDEL
jgi:hypothetical protein